MNSQTLIICVSLSSLQSAEHCNYFQPTYVIMFRPAAMKIKYESVLFILIITFLILHLLHRDAFYHYLLYDVFVAIDASGTDRSFNINRRLARCCLFAFMKISV